MATVADILAVEAPEFGRAVRAIITGDVEALRTELTAVPALVRAHSVAAHRATLLHYVSANGIESELQGPVANADAIAAVLLSAGAEADARCNAYDGRVPTTMNLLVSSDHPTTAGVAGRLVDLLCSAGAAVDGLDGDGSPLATALGSGTLECISALIGRGAATDNPAFAGAAGRADWLQAWFDGNAPAAKGRPPRWFPLSDDRGVAAEQALVYASMCGQTATVGLLLDRGVDINASPPGSHWTATPLHTAAIQGQTVVVDLLLSRGAEPTQREARYNAKPSGWLPHARAPRQALARAVAAQLERWT